MKNLINTLVFLLLISSSTLLAQINDSFILSGNLINSGVESSYTIYEGSDNNQEWDIVAVKKLYTEDYNLTLSLNRIYLIVFQTDETVKELYLNLSRSGEITMHIDFANSNHGVIYFFERKYDVCYFYTYIKRNSKYETNTIALCSDNSLSHII